MKKLLLLCSALALAGCNSSPSTGDIEKFLEPKFASCQNVAVVDIKKTNGYEEDGYYRVEYTYGIELNDPSVLTDFLQTYEQEKENMLAWQATMDNYDQRERSLFDEIDQLKREHSGRAPRREQFSTNGDSLSLSGDQEQEYFAALDQWKAQNPPPDVIKEKTAELNEIYEDRPKKRDAKPRLKLFRNADTAMESHYLKGCPGSTYIKFMQGIFDAPRQAAQSNQDARSWFKEYEIKMQGSVTMRKTENGWRALSEG